MHPHHGPIAGRIQRPRWTDPRLLIGLALIAIAIIGVSALVRSADLTEPYFVARHAITPGTEITLEHLAVAHVRVQDDVYLASDALEPGTVSTRVIAAQELIPLDALGSEDAVNARPVAIQASLPVASSVQRGSVVDVWITTEELDRPQSKLVAAGVVVTEIERDSGAFRVGVAQTVYVNVPVAQLADVLNALASDGDIAVLGMAGDLP